MAMRKRLLPWIAVILSAIALGFLTAEAGHVYPSPWYWALLSSTLGTGWGYCATGFCVGLVWRGRLMWGTLAGALLLGLETIAYYAWLHLTGFYAGAPISASAAALSNLSMWLPMALAVGAAMGAGGWLGVRGHGVMRLVGRLSLPLASLVFIAAYVRDPFADGTVYDIAATVVSILAIPAILASAFLHRATAQTCARSQRR